MSISFTDSLAARPPIYQKKPPADDKRIRILVLTNNSFKQGEYKSLLGNEYGVNLFVQEAPINITNDLVLKILTEMAPSPTYILREESLLANDITKEPISGLEIVNNPENAPRFLFNEAKLRVWIPKWNKEKSTLDNVISDQFLHHVKGYIDASRKDQRDDKVFGWDHLFVNAQTGKTNQETVNSLWGKTSARQLVLADFVTKYLFYPQPKSLQYHEELKPKRGVEFTVEMSVGRFMKNNIHLSNPCLSVWGLDTLNKRILNEGVFFKAATSRVVGHYFSPPLGGIPLTSKKTGVETTIFLDHDLNHHNIPDLIFDTDGSKEMALVQQVSHMISEPITMVIADMLYADTLVRSDPTNLDKVDQRIYPLFKALDIEEPNEQNRAAIIKRLLWANTQYALLGDDAAWKALLKPGQEDKLSAYKNHFEKFFVGDNIWTNANVKNMSAMKDFYKEWIETLGKDLFKKAGLLFVSEMTERIRQRGADFNSLKDLVYHIFEELIETRIFPAKFDDIEVDEEERLSRAFRRYMIGQMSFYFKYQDLLGVPERTKSLVEKLKGDFFDAATRDKIYQQFTNDVRYVWGTGIITSASADNFLQVHPIFPPVYINYNRQESKTIREAVDKIYGPPSWKKNAQQIMINTSNKGKLEEYESYFKPQAVVSQSMDLKEPAADPMTIIRYKASQFDDVLVDDVSLDVEGMEIGPNIRSYLSEKDPSELEGKKCVYVCRLAIKVNDVVRVYESSVKGVLVKPRGECFGFGKYFLPEGTEKTLGEYMNPEFNARYLAIQKFKEDKRTATLPVLKEWAGPFQE